MSIKQQKNGPLALIIDDEEAIGAALSGVLEDEGWRVICAGSGRDGLIAFKAHAPDLVFLDVWMPGLDGIATLQALKEMNEDIPMVIMSGHATIETAVRATRLGAFEFLEKPLSLDKILPIIEHAQVLRERKHTGGPGALKSHAMIGDSPGIVQIQRLVKVVSPRNAWVLITGENGTGKEVVAMNIHAQSSRAAKPFVALNCAAIPEELIESELFGHVKGAFTGATATQKGKFELAHQGTLFLDEIGDMSLRTQAKILRVLQEQEFERLGDDTPIKVDVRVIAATNKDLSKAISEGTFREDLFYRLNVIPLVLPPLRERGLDIVKLAEYFLSQMARELKEVPRVLSSEASLALLAWPWPGNVRELKNLMERLTILVAKPVIELADLPEALRRIGKGPPTGAQGSPSTGLLPTLKEAKSDFERTYILDKLQEFGWNVTKTAEAIGIERSNLHRKIRAYNIDPKKLKE